MKRLISMLVTLVLLATCFTAPAMAESEEFLVPAKFVAKFNTMIGMLADLYAEELGETAAGLVKEEYTLTQRDAQGILVYYDSKFWTLEAGFAYAEGTEPTDDMPAVSVSLVIKNSEPEGAREFAKFALKMVLAHEFQDEGLLEQLNRWFETVSDTADMLQLPGYTLTALFTEEYTQYAILPADSGSRAETQEKPESEPAPESSAWADARCAEDGFSTKIPAGSSTEYRDVKGQMGFTVYLGEKGSIPCVIIHRRAMDGKFKNPEKYLNNTYREFLESKYEEKGGSVGMNPAKTWEIGGKQLLGARYFMKLGDTETTQLQLIEIRDQGDVEYTALYQGEEEEKLALEALNAAVANYAED